MLPDKSVITVVMVFYLNESISGDNGQLYRILHLIIISEERSEAPLPFPYDKTTHPMAEP
jgi:hypothetical protein